MTMQDSGFPSPKRIHLDMRIQYWCGMFLTLFFLFVFHCSLVNASEKWKGVDEAVVEKIAKEYGREARKPFINTDQGDLLLFVFFVAGATGGFIAGYYWRILITGKESRASKEERET